MKFIFYNKMNQYKYFIQLFTKIFYFVSFIMRL